MYWLCGVLSRGWGGVWAWQVFVLVGGTGIGEWDLALVSEGVGLSWVTGSDWIQVCEVPKSRQKVVIVLEENCEPDPRQITQIWELSYRCHWVTGLETGLHVHVQWKLL